MKKYFFFLSMIGALLGFDLRAEECEKPSKIRTQNVSYGIDMFWMNMDTKVGSFRVDEGRFFVGSRFGYEYLKPKAFYTGIDLLSAITDDDFRAYYGDFHVPVFEHNDSFINLDWRLGYTFAPHKCLVTPFVGIGGYLLGPTDHYHAGFLQANLYWSAGLRSLFLVCPNFNIGLNLKVFGTMASVREFKYWDICKETEHPTMYGMEAGCPFVWYLGKKHKWDVELEPYFLKLDFKNTQDSYGAKLVFAYRF